MSISFTSANIAPQKNTLTRAFDAGAALTAGYAGYIDSSGEIQHADSNLSEAASRGIGVILKGYDDSTTIADTTRVSVAIWGEVEGFAGMTPGAPVYVGTTVGSYTHTAPSAYARAIGYALSAVTLFVNPESGNPASA